MTDPNLTPALAERFAQIALGHVAREYPHKLDHVLEGDADAQTPRQLHPVFFGSFDWHSCVHGYWLLARLRRRFPDIAAADAIAAQFDHAFTPAKIAAECAYFERASARASERPYGWAWLLMLAAELRRDARAGAQGWSAAVQPLADLFVARFRDFLPRLTYAIRTGTHFNTAFALVLAADYADVAEDTALHALLADRARDWFGGDRGAVAWEPSGDDFLSSTLIEAEAMRRLLPQDDFATWFDSFLPDLAARRPATLFTPAFVSDRSDGKTAHLDGLNLSRAWCMRSLGSACDDARAAVLAQAAAAHLDAALPHVAGDYMGEHWLASFALLAMDGV